MRILSIVLILLSGCAAIVYCTSSAMLAIDARSLAIAEGAERFRIVDRYGQPLSETYQNRWNLTDFVPLSSIPEPLIQAFVHAEDKRFYAHAGVDWRARGAALYAALTTGRLDRGASTISEQVVRLIHPRPRTIWSRWVEGFEAYKLEQYFSKAEILEFYLNQVPYARRRRGVVQAARLYFDRDLSTLNLKEMLSLAVLVRAPSRLDPITHGTAKLEAPLSRLAALIQQRGLYFEQDMNSLSEQSLNLVPVREPTSATHFVTMLRTRFAQANPAGAIFRSSLDSSLQQFTQSLLDRRISDLADHDVHDGAALIVQNDTGEVLAWVNAGDFNSTGEGAQIDVVRTPRQPGSTLKPFLYELALEQGWTASQLIDDSPIAEPVGLGLHRFRNYSGVHYGPIRLREALGNSLNIPAIRTVEFIGADNFLKRLHALGFVSLQKNATFYGDGLALGNGEVTLEELVRGYATIARQGRSLNLSFRAGEISSREQLLSRPATSIVTSILSDPSARRREFGEGDLLRFPVETAIKTGTSTDYRDAWAIGFSERFTVGVWIGNLDRKPMNEITGSRGPTLVLRGIFNFIEKRGESKPLFRDPDLIRRRVCSVSGDMWKSGCPMTDELFMEGSVPVRVCPYQHETPSEISALPVLHKGRKELEIEFPTPGLLLARDPRIPDSHEGIQLHARHAESIDSLTWYIDDVPLTAEQSRGVFWNITSGRHEVRVEGFRSGQKIAQDSAVFFVKN